MSTTPEGWKELYCQWAWEGHSNVCAQILEVLVSPGYSETLGLHPGASKRYEDGETKFVLRYALKFACNLLYARLLAGFQYMYYLPYFFLRLLSPDLAKVRAALTTLSTWNEVLSRMEQQALRRPDARALVSSLLWPRYTWVREMLVRLAEDKFERVGPIVAGEVEHFSRGMLTTRPVELAFNDLRDRGRHHKAKQMNEASKWQVQINSKILAEHGRPPLPTTSAAKAAAPTRLPDSCFQPAAYEDFSLGKDTLNSLGLDPAPWPTPSPPTMRLGSLSWITALANEGDLGAMDRNWLSLLAEPETVLHGPTLKDVRGHVVRRLRSLVAGVRGPSVGSRALFGRPLAPQLSLKQVCRNPG